MSTRSLRARLDRLGRPPVPGPVCRWHDESCGLGARWPLPYEGSAVDELAELVEGARRRQGLTPWPTRRERWAREGHEAVPEAELEERRRHLAAAVAAAEAENERVLAEMAADT
ncbi:hypothetical protein [Streptomyces sp. IBSBF 2435]|uniref:hypothetical protein n=1 Tax=Streptomyces sp. IBSBF 2435 TaxID=2903531 RepID=UPI002FDBB4EA